MQCERVPLPKPPHLFILIYSISYFTIFYNGSASKNLLICPLFSAEIAFFICYTIAMIIYVDILFFTNFLMDAILLAATALFADRKARPWRLGLSAAAAALFGCFLFFWKISPLLLFLIKFLLPALSLLIAFPFERIATFGRTLLIFWGVHLLFGGGMYAFYSLTDAGSQMRLANGIYYLNIPLWGLLLLTFGFYGLSHLFFFLLEHKKEKSFLHTLTIDGTELLALLDTGNSLYDPITLSPVILCQWDALPLPEPLLQAALHQDPSALPRLSKAFPHLHLQLLPYTDISGKRILIYAYRPKKLLLDGLERQGLVGLSLQPLSPDGRFQALLHRDWSNL